MTLRPSSKDYQGLESENCFMTTNAIEFTNGRLKITGDILAYQVFEKPFRIGPRPPRKKKALTSKTDKPMTRTRNLYLAKARLMDWINCNVNIYRGKDGQLLPPIFITLTFSDDITDLNEAHRQFSKFITDINYQVFKTKKAYLKYGATFEIQKGRQKKYGVAVWHYHMIIFNWEMIDSTTGVTPTKRFWDNKDKKLLQEIWGHGWIDIRDITQVKNVGWYMTKYMVKDANDPSLNGRISYLVSKGLKKMTTIYNSTFVDMLIHDFPGDTLRHFKQNIKLNHLESKDRLIFNLSEYPEIRQRNEELIRKYLGEQE